MNPTAGDSDEKQQHSKFYLHSGRNPTPSLCAYPECRTLIGDAVWAAVLPNLQFQSELNDFSLNFVKRFQTVATFTVSHGGGQGLPQHCQPFLACAESGKLLDVFAGRVHLLTSI
jgi:hypothetical protein